jgi:hypothetical protein
MIAGTSLLSATRSAGESFVAIVKRKIRVSSGRFRCLNRLIVIEQRATAKVPLDAVNGTIDSITKTAVFFSLQPEL